LRKSPRLWSLKRFCDDFDIFIDTIDGEYTSLEILVNLHTLRDRLFIGDNNVPPVICLVSPPVFPSCSYGEQQSEDYGKEDEEDAGASVGRRRLWCPSSRVEWCGCTAEEYNVHLTC